MGSSTSAQKIQLDSWNRIARELDWFAPWTEVWSPSPPFGTWFSGGRLNVFTNCVERHLADRPHKPALLWEGEPGDRRTVSYETLHQEVLSLERSLRGMGVGPGDRVALHLGWIPEAVVVILACARIGALYTIVPTPLHTDGLAERLIDFSPKVLVTQDGAWRRGAIQPLKARADEALSALGNVEQTVVVRRTGVDVAWYEGDRWYHELVSAYRPGAARTPERAAALPASQPLISVHLANRRGKPVSVVLSAANVLVSAAAIHKYGVSDGGVFWLPGDASWLATQVHGIYGPLCAGDTMVMFEGTVDTPTHARAWEIIERYAVSTLLLSPSLARTLREWSPQLGGKHSLGSLRRCVTLGEKTDPDLAHWLAAELGKGNVSVADAWGQMELGGIVDIDKPVDRERLPDAGLRLLDEDGRPTAAGQVGEVVLTNPWPGMASGVFGVAAADVVRNHWNRYPGVYATGDMAKLGENQIQFLGRRDQVVSISGQLVSLTEVRDMLLEHPYVQSADVIETYSHVRGLGLLAAVVLDSGVPATVTLNDVAHEVLESVRDTLGGLARPRSLIVLDRFGDELTATDRRTALGAFAGLLPTEGTVTELSWSQVLAASGHTED